MRGARSLGDCLNEIVQWGEKLARHIDGMDEPTFLADEKTQDAAAKCAEAIGSAGKEALEIDPEFDLKYPSARLTQAYASRNRLSHGYHSIDYNLLWITVSQSIPATVAAVKTALERFDSTTGA